MTIFSSCSIDQRGNRSTISSYSTCPMAKERKDQVITIKTSGSCKKIETIAIVSGFNIEEPDQCREPAATARGRRQKSSSRLASCGWFPLKSIRAYRTRSVSAGHKVRLAGLSHPADKLINGFLSSNQGARVRFTCRTGTFF